MADSDEKLAKQCAERKQQRAEQKRKRGRPTNKEIAAKKKGGRGVRGRPPGDAAIVNEYKARMLASPKSAAVLEAIMDAALDDGHKNQAAAWKIVTDRIAPISYFEKDKMSGGRASISINISGVGVPAISGEEAADSDESTVDAEYTEVHHGDE